MYAKAGIGLKNRALAAVVAGMTVLVSAAPGLAQQVTAFKQAIAEGAASDTALAEFYRARDYKPLWTGKSDSARRTALIKALADAEVHGLPAARYDDDVLMDLFKQAKTQRALGVAEVEASKMFLQYAQDLQSGVLEPNKVVADIKRTAPRRDRLAQIEAFSKSSPRAYLKNLVPDSPEYNRLLAAKMEYERLLGKGGWGATVPGKKLEPGDSGNAVVALRNRLIAMGYLGRTATTTYDADIQKAVQQFQLDHGLLADGVAGDSTLSEINQPVEARLQSIIVAMERERWVGADRGKRHVLVNIADFHARIVDDGKVAFKTRSVVGKNTGDRRTPEFSDVMEHMVINPTWNVPRSIATKEYLPLLQKNPNAVSHLRLINSKGQTISRDSVDFTQFTTRNFPFDIKQPPSDDNALGLVKFMFPNQYNIYLHDTPAKSLFSRESRAFSHGCVRLSDPFDFAYELLSKQETNPEAYFQNILATRRETIVPLKQPLPVHLIYRTAMTEAKGKVQFRRDVYGRDAQIFNALAKAGVVLRAVQS